MANITEKVQAIRKAVYGEEVRESIASSIEEINKEVEFSNKTSASAFEIATESKTIAKSVVDAENARVQAELNRQANFEVIKSDYATYKNVMISESNVAALQNNIDKITAGLGGRNLVLNSTNLQTKMVPYGVEGTISKVSDIYPISKTAFKIEVTKFTPGSGNGSFFFPIFQKTGEKLGKTFTWSCYIYTKTAMSLSMGHQSGGGLEIVTATSWQKVSHTWTFTDSEYYQFFITNRNPWNIGDTIYIADLKIEEGTVPSTWTPAPEDIDSTIAGKSNISHTHSETDIISGFGQSLTPNGYRVFPGGLILQWGTVKATAKSGYVNGTFPKPFSNVCFGLNANMIYNGTVLNVTTTEQVLDLTKFNIYVREGSNAIPQTDITLFWRAIGV